MSGPALGDFSGRLDELFLVRVGEHELELRLESARELPGSVRDAGGFQLEFSGPPDPVLAQGIFPFEQGGERFELFVVPIGRTPEGARYDVTFF
jgi:hypothetical protein